MGKFFLILIGCLVVKFCWNVYKPRPIQFDRFWTEKELQVYLDERYLGKDINLLLSDAVKSGVDEVSVYRIKSERDMLSSFRREEIKKYKDIFAYSYMLKYVAFILSKQSMYLFKIYPKVDKEGKIFFIRVNSISVVD